MAKEIQSRKGTRRRMMRSRDIGGDDYSAGFDQFGQSCFRMLRRSRWRIIYGMRLFLQALTNLVIVCLSSTSKGGRGAFMWAGRRRRRMI